KPLFQSHCLDREDFLASSLPLLCRLRNKRERRKCSGKHRLFLSYGKCYLCEFFFPVCLKRRIFSSLGKQSLNIDLTVYDLISESLRGCKDRSVFRYDIVSSEHHIRSGF